MESLEILENLFDTKMIDILRVFINNESKQYYQREIAKMTNTSPASTYRIMARLTELNILELTQIKKLKLYKLAQNKSTEFLKSFLKIEKRIVEAFVDQIKSLPGLQQVLTVGDDKEDRANLILIGENIDPAEIKRLCAGVKEKYSFTVSTFSLTLEQYEQMLTMGLYPGKKKTLFKR
ncbi:hypothetical protein JW930_02200 [Candidatus Woesearchaeota archaeon]|nr:hypothetical protein [Candidatus Woesearchaeota archaeon]